MIRHFALMGALCLSVSGVAFAQPGTAVVAPVEQVEVVTPIGDALLFNVRLTNASAITVLRLIAQRGNLQMVVNAKGEPRISSLSLSRLLATSAMHAVCEQTGLVPELRNGVWFISPAKELPTPRKNEDKLGSMEFEDVDATTLLSFISEHYKLMIAVDQNVAGKINFIRLSDKTPQEAIEIIASAIDCTVTKQKDGIYLVESNAVHKPIVSVPTSTPTTMPVP